jgi:hypothetical protein
VNAKKLVLDGVPDDIKARIADLVKYAEDDGRVEALAAVDRHLQTEGEVPRPQVVKDFIAELRTIYESRRFRDAIPAGRDAEKVGGWPT